MRGWKNAFLTQEGRLVCSDLVGFRRRRSGKLGRPDTAILEEIGPEGAVVQLEREVACQTPVRLECPAVAFDGVVLSCRYVQGMAYFAEIAFDAGQRWSVDLYRPQYMLDSGARKPRPSRRAVDPPSELAETARRVEQNLAVICGTMDYVELAEYFVHHFGAAPESDLFTQFARAYRDARENLVGPYEQPVSLIWQALKIATLLANVPDGTIRHPAHL